MLMFQRIYCIQNSISGFLRPVRLASQLRRLEQLRKEIVNGRNGSDSRVLQIPQLDDTETHSFTQQMIMNTLNKAQLLVLEPNIQETYKIDYDSPFEKYTLKDGLFESYLRSHRAKVPNHLAAKLKLTSDSHKRLDVLLKHSRPLNVPPQSYLEYYLRVRHNVSESQLLQILSGLINHRWYKNASMILIENCDTLDDILELSLTLLSLIERQNDQELGVCEFLINFQSDAVLPQLLRSYEIKSISEGKSTQLPSLKDTVILGKFFREKITTEYLDQFESIEYLSEDLNEFFVDYDDENVPFLIQLQMIITKIHYIDRHCKTLEKIQKLTELVDNELLNSPLTSVPGVIARIVPLISSIAPIGFSFKKFLTSFSLNTIDLHHIMRLNLTLEEVDLLYDSQMKDVHCILAVLDKYIKLNDTNKTLLILKNHSKDLPLHHIGLILALLRKDLKKFLKAISYIDKSKYSYVLKIMATRICSEYAECNVTAKKEATMITFEDIFSIIYILKCAGLDHFSYMNLIFHDVIMDDGFISVNEDGFEQNLIRFTSDSRLGLQMLIDWNGKLFTKYTEGGKRTAFVNPIFMRNILIAVTRIQEKKRRDFLLDKIGINLTLLPPKTLAILFNEVINSVDKSSGKRVNDLKITVTMARKILDSYVRVRLSQEFCVQNLFVGTMNFLNGLSIDKRHNVPTYALTSFLKHSLMQIITERDANLAFLLIVDSQDTSLLKGYLKGVVASERLTADEKLKSLRRTLNDKFFAQDKFFIGKSVVIELCDQIVEQLNQGEMNSLTQPHTFLWALKQCKMNNVDSDFYEKWYARLKLMRQFQRGYWTPADRRV